MSLSITEHVRRLNLLGIPTFGCHNAPGDKAVDKTPLHAGGFYNAQCDPELAELGNWDKYGFLVGVPTGPASGIAVVDVDPRNGGDAWYATHKEKLPKTRVHQTRSGGFHLLFKDPGGTVRNSASKIAPGVDVRGDGGYVVWWPAHGLPVLDDMPLDQLPDWPDWLVPAEPEERARTARALRRGGPGDWSGVASPHRIDSLIERVRSEPEGNRNALLFWAAYKIAEMRFEHPAHRDRALNRLLDAAVWAGLEPDAALKTIVSGLHNAARGRG